MNEKTKQMYQQLEELGFYYGADILINTIGVSMLIIYICFFKYKELSFEYMKRIVTIITISFTVTFSYIFYMEDKQVIISKEIRELQLKQIESNNKDYKNVINIYIKDLKETSKEISDLIEVVTKIIKSFSCYVIILLIVLFFFEFFIKIKPQITSNFLKKNTKVSVHWRDKRKQSFYYNLKHKS